MEYLDEYEDIYELLELEQTGEELKELGISLDLSQLLTDMVDGNGHLVGAQLVSVIKDGLIGELVYNKSLMLQILVIVLLGAVFVNLASSFGTGFVSENGFYITYLIITSVMLVSFSTTLDMVVSTINKLLMVTRVIVPLYGLAMNFVGQSVSTAGMYEMVMVGIWIVQVIILRFIIPMIKFYVIISLINNLNKEDSFSKMSTLVLNVVNWVLKTVVLFIIGLNLIKGLIEPQIDALGRNTINRVATLLPGGGIVTSLTGTFLGAGAVVKNSIGVVGIIVLIFVVLMPIIKLVVTMFTVRLTAVMIQPIGERRYVEGVESLAKGNQLLIQTLFSSVVLFMLILAIVAYSTKL